MRDPGGGEGHNSQVPAEAHTGIRERGRNMPLSLKFFLAVVAAPVMTLAGEPRRITASEAAAILGGGVEVRIGTHGKRTISGKVLQAADGGVTVTTGKRETRVAMTDIDWFRVSTSRGNKRTWLPLILCATAGTAALVAAGAAEEKKSTYLPLAAGVTAGLGVSGYYLGKSSDFTEVTYRLE